MLIVVECIGVLNDILLSALLEISLNGTSLISAYLISHDLIIMNFLFKTSM